jgi:hypothetical protein
MLNECTNSYIKRFMITLFDHVQHLFKIYAYSSYANFRKMFNASLALLRMFSAGCTYEVTAVYNFYRIHCFLNTPPENVVWREGGRGNKITMQLLFRVLFTAETHYTSCIMNWRNKCKSSKELSENTGVLL